MCALDDVVCSSGTSCSCENSFSGHFYSAFQGGEHDVAHRYHERTGDHVSVFSLK